MLAKKTSKNQLTLPKAILEAEGDAAQPELDTHSD